MVVVAVVGGGSVGGVGGGVVVTTSIRTRIHVVMIWMIIHGSIIILIGMINSYQLLITVVDAVALQ